MNYKKVGSFIWKILLGEVGVLLIPLAMALYSGERVTIMAFVNTISLTLIISGLMRFLSWHSDDTGGLSARDGLVCVGLTWIIISLLGCLPFVLSGEIPNFIDALFEIVSGFTTTGASILTEVESHSAAVLWWRSFSHWVGGMGVLVLLLALDRGQKNGSGETVYLLRAESPGPTVGKLVARMQATALKLYLLYIGLTILDIVFLLFGGMNLFEAFFTAFGTAGTGGFGVKNDSLASYSPYIQNVTTIFMLLFGVNFTCYHLLWIRRFSEVYHDEELRFYLLIVVAGIAAITVNIRSMYGSLADTVRHAAFQVSTIITTTGFATTDFDLWPTFSKMILLGLMLVGACAGSTGGGFKVGRLLLLLKNLRRNIHKSLHANKVELIKSNGTVVGEDVIDNLNGYLAAYVIILVGSILLVSLDGFSVTTSISGVIACFNNIGPGFDLVGPTGNYSMFSPLSKIVLTLDMLAGRLEIFPILVLFSGHTWMMGDRSNRVKRFKRKLMEKRR